MAYPVLFVSLGPGDPELITLKALKALQQADCIYCPATLTPSGKRVSRSADILEALDIDPSAIHLFHVPMKKDRTLAWEAYSQVEQEAAALCEEGKKVVIVAEGDAGFYSSIHYIQDKFAVRHIPTGRIPGIPAFIAAGAVAGLHVVKQEEPLLVLPGTVTTEELTQALTEGKTVVIMKLSQCEAAIKSCLNSCEGHTWHYFENVGLEKAFYSCCPEEILAKEFPYFSLMIIK